MIFHLKWQITWEIGIGSVSFISKNAFVQINLFHVVFIYVAVYENKNTITGE